MTKDRTCPCCGLTPSVGFPILSNREFPDRGDFDAHLTDGHAAVCWECHFLFPGAPTPEEAERLRDETFRLRRGKRPSTPFLDGYFAAENAKHSPIYASNPYDFQTQFRSHCDWEFGIRWWRMKSTLGEMS